MLKLTADPAFERARRRGLFRGSLAEFQGAGAGASLPFGARDATSRRAAHVVCPSAYLAELDARLGRAGDGRGAAESRAPIPPVCRRATSCARATVSAGATLVFAGRLTAQKSLELAIEACRRVAGVGS